MRILVSVISVALQVQVIVSQSISASYSLISGSPQTGAEVAASFSAGYRVFGPSSTPGGRSHHSMAMFNNRLYSFHGFPAPKNDVWVFAFVKKRWAWMAGKPDMTRYSEQPTPIFGSLGLPDSSNTPGFRNNFGGDIHQVRGEYVLFGGFSGGGLVRGDLWTFNMTSYSWTWIAGSSSFDESPAYSSMIYSTPGARFALGCAVSPSTDEFLLFGGGADQFSYKSDMWAFSFNTMRWAWISGTSLTNSSASVGQRGQWSTAFYPSSRRSIDLVRNSQSDILYLFGGMNNNKYLNDLWAFKRDTLEWSWRSGVTSYNSAGTCGVKGYPSLRNTPGARYSHKMVYHETSGLLIMFGGFGYSCSNSSTYFSDTWAFNPGSNGWAWIAGPSILTIPTNHTILGPQIDSAMAVDPDSSAIFMFGGTGYLSPTVRGNVDYLWYLNIVASSSSSTGAASYSTISRPIQSSSVSDQKFSDILDLTTIESYQTELVGSSTRAGETSVAYSSTSFKKLSVKTSSFKSDIAQNASTTLEMLWSIKYRLLAYILAALLVLSFCFIFKLTFSSKIGSESTGPANALSTSTMSGSKAESSITSNTSMQNTLVDTSLGVYVPGALQVDSTTAYLPIKEIARGGGGSVWMATAYDPALTSYGEKVIVKIPNGKLVNDRSLALFYQEIALLNAFKKHENIAKLLGYTENPHSTILKYYRRGSLSKWISSGLRTLRQLNAFLSDISCGIWTLHTNGVVHCDLKPDNVLVDYGSRLFAVITDFGISRIVTDKLLKVDAYEVQFVKGASLAYASPEAIEELRRKKVVKMTANETMARDIYAIGVIMTALLSGKNAWK